MVTGNTLLAHLSSRFTGQTENIAVEALGHILSSSESARRGLEDILQAGGVRVGNISGVFTQSTGKERERPDLACHSGSVETVLIEAKFWAGLTENQPGTYLNRLPENRSFESLWAELRRRIEESEEVSITLGQTVSGEGYRAASAGSARVLLMTSWSALLDRMESRAGESDDGVVRNDIQQLRGLAIRTDSETLLPMRREQLGPEFPIFVTHMKRLVDDATTRAAERDLIVRGERSPGRNGFRRTIQVLPEPNCPMSNYFQYFGVDFDLWRQFRDTPLWVTFPGPRNWNVFREKLYARELKHLNPIDFVDSARAIPISLRMGVEYYAIVEDVVRQIKELSDLLIEEENNG